MFTTTDWVLLATVKWQQSVFLLVNALTLRYQTHNAETYHIDRKQQRDRGVSSYGLNPVIIGCSSGSRLKPLNTFSLKGLSVLSEGNLQHQALIRSNKLFIRMELDEAHHWVAGMCAQVERYREKREKDLGINKARTRRPM